MKYALIFGKNWQLSLAEILAYFEKKQTNWTFVDLSKKALVIEAEINPTIVNELGGTMKIAKITHEFDFNDFNKQKFTEEEVHEPLSVYGSYELLKIIRKKFRDIPKDKTLDAAEIIKKRIKENCLVFCLEKTYYGPTVTVHNVFDEKKRDEKRPHHDYLSIAPSRARILMNLSQATNSVLDPFCGIGTIPAEAVILGVKSVHCSDINKEAIRKTQKNLEWTKKEYMSASNFKTTTIDARQISNAYSNIQAIASEPDLGPALKDRISKADAEKIFAYLHILYKSFFSSAYKALQKNALVAFVFPCINTREGKVFINKRFDGFEIIDPFTAIPNKYREYLKLNRRFILDEEREKGHSRVTVREFTVLRKKGD